MTALSGPSQVAREQASAAPTDTESPMAKATAVVMIRYGMFSSPFLVLQNGDGLPEKQVIA
jgi:hypothetical protein